LNEIFVSENIFEKLIFLLENVYNLQLKKSILVLIKEITKHSQNFCLEFDKFNGCEKLMEIVDFLLNENIKEPKLETQSMNVSYSINTCIIIIAQASAFSEKIALKISRNEIFLSNLEQTLKCGNLEQIKINSCFAFGKL
jgi:hypothetical protein